MEEEDTKLCSNCKREIPAVNFTTHSVHCARNIRPCPVCKEPVPVSQLEEHHDALHKEVPCKKCGESVCGTDLEDHIRDSCAQTIKPCRYCELELPRRSLPGHETYCGARSEQCAECGEYVMAKYRQLHRDSNHGFIRLDEDPVPAEARPKPKPVTNGFPKNVAAASANRGPRTEIRHFNGPGVENRPAKSSRNSDVDNSVAASSRTSNMDNNAAASFRSSNLDNIVAASSRSSNVDNRFADSSRNSNMDNRFAEVDNRYADSSTSSSVDNRLAESSRSSKVDNRLAASSRSSNGTRVTAKRTNDQPQINTSVKPTEKVNKQLPSRGAVKKRPAPPPPPPPGDARRDHAYFSAARRRRDEDRRRDEQTAYNLSVDYGQKKVELKKDLKNRGAKVTDTKEKLIEGLPPVLSAADKLEKLRKMDALHNRETETQDYKNCLQGRVWQPMDVPTGHVLGRGSPRPSSGHVNGANDLSNLQPMSQEQFMDRFSRLQVGGARADRFDEIKTSLRALRRGLNEVTAPYNSSSNHSNNSNNVGMQNDEFTDDDLYLPCEFCGEAINADDLVMHQTGCRPDLARLDPQPYQAVRPPTPTLPTYPTLPSEEPVIPCEFCTESLPVYLISEHQERCRREANILYPD